MPVADKLSEEARAKALGLTTITPDERLQAALLIAVEDVAAAIREATVAYEATASTIQALLAKIDVQPSPTTPPGDPLP